MKLEPNMYVRTKEGLIFKIEKYLNRENNIQLFYKECKVKTIKNIDEIKASHNIIDLIEVGDYVNGCRVEEHAHEKGKLFVTYTYIGGKGFTTYEDYSWELTKDREEDIKSIVTKEQFESMQYVID